MTKEDKEEILHQIKISECKLGWTLVFIAMMVMIILLSGCREDCTNHNKVHDAMYNYELNENNQSWVDGRFIDQKVLDEANAAFITGELWDVQNCIDEVDFDKVNKRKDAANCEFNYIPNSIECIQGVKVVWEDGLVQKSCDGQFDLLSKEPSEIYNCQAKGLNQDFNDCPCLYRVALQEDSIIVIPKDLALLRLALVQYITQCANPYEDEQLKECVK